MLKNIKKFCFMGIFCFMLFLLFPVTVAHAEPETGGNAAGEDGGAGQNKVIGGPYFEKSGWLVYIIDDSNHQVSETLVIYGSARKPDSSYTEYTKTKFGGKFDDYDSNLYVKWTPPYPYEKNGTANGPAIKSAMLQNDYVLDFITEYFGASMLQRFIDKELYLILEPFFWGQMYDGKNPTGIYLCATARGWADMQKKLGIDEYGSPRINRFTNNTYPNCVKLEYPQFGLEPLSGKLTNTQIMSSGNGFMAFWASEDVETPLPEEEEVVANRQLYAIKNWSDDFDISRGIPSGEEVRNTYEASSFFANSVIKTATSSPKQYSATYTYKELVTYSIPMIGPDGEEMTNPKTGETLYETWSQWETCATNSFSFSAKASYQFIDEIEAYAFEKLKVVNNALAYHVDYDKSNASQWHEVVADIRRYTADGVYHNTGQLDCKDIADTHYFLPDAGIVQNQTIYVGSTSAAYARMAADEHNAKNAVYNASWSRNDNLTIKAGSADYIFMQDTPVTGCIIDGHSSTSSATSAYSYGAAGLDTASVKPVRSKGESKTLIPPSTDNGYYPTGVTATYKSIASTKNTVNAIYRAGRGIYTAGTVDSIYNHIIDGALNGTNYNGQDRPAGDGYDIKVHTPVISPIMITTYLGTPQWYADEQLIDVDPSADFQLKLDANYMVKWNTDQWISYKYGQLKGYEEDGGFPSRYDKYIERKELKFPFDVYYNAEFYEAGTWIEIEEPNNYNTVWNNGLSLEQKSAYVSKNHWQMTPIYIPSYAKEGTGYIQARVYAHNVEGRYEGSHNVEDAMELTKNTHDKNYIASYSVKDQLSGHIYGFTVTGVDDRDMYDEIDLDLSIWERLGYGFCPVKEEKVAGPKNRFGQDLLRHQVDGSLTSFTVNADGSLSPWYNLLPLRDGSNETAGLHTGDGKLWMGLGFGFNLKTIANLSGNNDYIQIVPTFRFYDKTGVLVDEIRMNGDQMISTHNRLIALFYDKEGNLRNFFNTTGKFKYTIAMGNPNFDGAYYTSEQTIKTGDIYKRYGNWVDYTLQRWNKTNNLYGNAARTRVEMMDLAWPCYTNTLITLDSNFRMLTGEWEQLYKNRNREGSDVATYYDFDEDGAYDQGIGSSMDTDFRDSMQTWYGGYCMPGALYIYDNINNDFQSKSSFTMQDFTSDFDVIINFDIIAYENGTPHLSYGGYINGGRVWEKEGYDNSQYRHGDVVIYDMTHYYSDKFEGHLINVN